MPLFHRNIDAMWWLEKTRLTVNLNKKECIVIRDFNLDFMMDLFYIRKLQTTILNMDMKYYIDKQTRIMKDSRTIIDLIFSNK